MSKDSLAKGTIILTLSAFIARFLGLVQRIPLQNLLGDSGMATYSISYNIYFLFFTIATAGLPSAVSKLVSERM
ncbi:MAG: oligosaccharide flippase family protein, partial [Gorillibacterium sp.]|nr:oligosaccharide flippase family protein [Gorillibacterium sp.]